MDWTTLANKALMYAPIATPIIAFCAFWAAIAAILTQRSTARKRAALDLFFKTEMDKTIIDAAKAYEEASDKLTSETKLDEFSQTDEYRNIIHFLDINELIAVGIHTGVLDDKVCFNFWADQVMDPCREVQQIIKYARERHGDAFTYIDLEKLNFKWVQRHQEQVRRHELIHSALKQAPVRPASAPQNSSQPS